MTTDIIERIVQQNLGVYRAAPSRLQEDVSQEAQVASDYRGRLVYELLQNADDAMEGEAGVNDTVAFVVTDSELWMANNGRSLTESDVQGLCGLGASSKVDAHGTRRASIGHKGLGFKSVLEISENPRVFSHTHSFALGARYARQHVDRLWADTGRPAPRMVPSMRFPASVTEKPAKWSSFAARGFKTAFEFPFREDVDQSRRDGLGDLLVDLPLTTVLFLKHLERVEVYVDQGDRTLKRTWSIQRELLRDDGSWISVAGLTGSGLYRVRISTNDQQEATFLVAHDGDVQIGSHRLGLSGPAWEGVEISEVSLAVLDPAEKSATMPPEWRRFHVFLPTEEACPYPLLVNAAFTTDLSRQQVRVSSEPTDYNAHLIREAARIFREVLIPQLKQFGTSAILQVLDRRADADDGSAAGTLHRAFVSELADVPLLPTETGEHLSLPQAVLPPVILEAEGSAFRGVLGRDPEWFGRRFPISDYCVGQWASVAADHGSRALSPAEALTVLGTLTDAEAASLRDHESGGFEIDPVLELCVALWDRADSEERETVERQARLENLFPVQRNDDRTVERVALGTETAFYPPRSARHELPLEGLRFMSHAVCWGAMYPKERTVLLEDRMKAWNALFDIRDFRFQEVMRAAVIPALVLNPDEEAAALHSRLQDMDALSAICQLAGTYAKPDRPLRYERLRSDRPLFNLSRLPVPCRLLDGEETWLPAYKVYFGSDWIGTDSMDHVLDSIPTDMLGLDEIDLPFLAPPSQFVGRLRDLDDSDESIQERDEVVETEDEEVGLDEDTDRALESDEHSRWLSFLSWIGVNQALRPIHFHDVEDRETGWLSTKNLEQPGGWAFRSLNATWDTYRKQLERAVVAAGTDGAVPYLYELHDLEAIVPILRCAVEDADGRVGEAFMEHLVRHWDSYEDFTEAQLALVGKGKWPSQRSKPPRATLEELTDGGDNLWLFRLHRRSFVPTSHGPRRPDQAWVPSAEVERRFGRRGRSSGDLLPLLQIGSGLPARQVRTVAERLGIRQELSPSTFTIHDAKLLCERLETLYGSRAIDASALRTVIRPVYRQLFELLSGSAGDDSLQGRLAAAPLLAETKNGLEFIEARDVFYARTPGYRERSGIRSQVPMFVLEAQPRATAPLSRLFGVQTLEDVVSWNPDPGDPALKKDELAEFRAGFHELVPELLARMRAERADDRDRRVLQDFVERVEPVESLELSCTLNGQELDAVAGREYFVRHESKKQSLQAFILWEGRAWPPEPREAQLLAMALADVLEVNLVETFVAFLQSNRDQRMRLLTVAGAVGYLAEIEDLLAHEGDVVDAMSVDSEKIPKTPPSSADEQIDETPARAEDAVSVAAPRIPLHRLEDLIFDGDPMLVLGEYSGSTVLSEHGPPQTSPGGSSRSHTAAPGTDLTSLDNLGMAIALSYELRRLERDGAEAPSLVVPGVDTIVGGDLVIDVSSPAAIKEAEMVSPVAKAVLQGLGEMGLSLLFPGFDLLAVRRGQPQRLIELKSSGVDARVQTMSWNEWKTARHSGARKLFWLYLVGNLRADLPSAPYLRAIQDPFGSLQSEEHIEHAARRAVQLRVREFTAAEEVTMTVKTGSLQDRDSF